MVSEKELGNDRDSGNNEEIYNREREQSTAAAREALWAEALGLNSGGQGSASSSDTTGGGKASGDSGSRSSGDSLPRIDIDYGKEREFGPEEGKGFGPKEGRTLGPKDQEKDFGPKEGKDLEKIFGPKEEKDFGPKTGDGEKDKATDPWGEMRRQIQEQKEKERAENINKIVESITKDGKFPEDIDRMLRDFMPAPYFGYYGDAAGLSKFVQDINDRLKAAGAGYSIDMQSFEQKSDSRDHFSPYASWTQHELSIRNGAGQITDRTSMITDPIAKPGVRF